MIHLFHRAPHALREGAARACIVLAVTALSVLVVPRAQARLLVSEYGSHSIQLYNAGTGAAAGTFVPMGSGGLQDPSSLRFGPDGNLYVSDPAGILRYNGLTGVFLDIFVPAGRGGLDHPSDLVFGPDGSLSVISQGTASILHYDGHTGAFIGAFVPAGSGEPAGEPRWWRTSRTSAARSTAAATACLRPAL